MKNENLFCDLPLFGFRWFGNFLIVIQIKILLFTFDLQSKKVSKIEDGLYFDVKLKKKSSEVPDLEQFFNVPQ